MVHLCQIKYFYAVFTWRMKASEFGHQMIYGHEKYLQRKLTDDSEDSLWSIYDK